MVQYAFAKLADGIIQGIDRHAFGKLWYVHFTLQDDGLLRLYDTNWNIVWEASVCACFANHQT